MLGGFHGPLIGDNTTTSSEASEIDKIKQREQKAKGLILSTVSQVLKRELHGLSNTTTSGSSSKTTPATAQQMWDHLKSKFKEKTARMLFLDIEKLLRSDLVDDGTMEAQLNKLSEIRSTCAFNDFELQDCQFISIILYALPERYRNVVDRVLHSAAEIDIKKLSIDDVKAQILDQEACYYGTSSSDRKGGPTDKCKYCNNLGHQARNCRKKKKDAKAKVKDATHVPHRVDPRSSDRNPESTWDLIPAYL